MAQKSTRIDVAARIEEVLRIRLDGAQFHDVVQYGIEKGWGVKEASIWKYIGKADKLIRERTDRRRGVVLSQHLAMRRALYARAINAADFRTALAILADEAKLRGLYPQAESEKAKAPQAGPDLAELATHIAALLASQEPPVTAADGTVGAVPESPPVVTPSGTAGESVSEPSG